MTRMKGTPRKWLYPIAYLFLLILTILPPITELPYDPRNTQDVIMSILMVSTTPYQAYGWIFHAATLVLVVLIIWKPDIASRLTAAYFGLNYLVIGVLQTNTYTESFGFAIHTGALISSTLLGLLWLWAAWTERNYASAGRKPAWRWILLPFALLVFWSPLAVVGTKVVPNFNPLLLLTSHDYGLTYCFMTPVFLFFLILFYPGVNRFAFRVTAFNGLLYGLLNLTHWFDPELRWLGVMHLPLLVIPLAALLIDRIEPLAPFAEELN